MGLTRAIAYLSGGRLVISTAVRFVYPFLPAIARGLGIDLTQAGLLLSARWVSGLATPALVRASGGGNRRLVVIGLSLFTLGMTVTAASGVFPGALVGFAAVGLAAPTFALASQSYVSDRVPYHRRARALSVMEITWSLALLLGAPAAGWLIGRLGWQAPFWVLAGAGAAAVMTVWWALDKDTPAPLGHASSLKLDRRAVTVVVVLALFMTGAEVTFVVYGAWLEDRFGLGLLALGVMSSVIAVSELTGESATFAFTDRLGKRRSIGLGLAVAIVGYLTLAAVESTLVVGIGVLAVALLGFEFSIVSWIPLATEVRPLARPRFLAVASMVGALARAGGTALGPALYTRFGLPGNAIASAVLNAAALALLVFGLGERQGDTHAASESPPPSI
jgi:MFS transporter, DHA1 family, inner membrane transport protein